MHDNFGFGVAFDIYRDRFPRKDDNLGDALIGKAMVDDFLAGIASRPKNKNFHGDVSEVFLISRFNDFQLDISMSCTLSGSLVPVVVDGGQKGEVAMIEYINASPATLLSKRPTSPYGSGPSSFISE